MSAQGKSPGSKPPGEGVADGLLTRRRDPQGREVVAFSGRLDAEAAGRLWEPAMEAVRDLTKTAGARVHVDAHAVSVCDSGGAMLLTAMDEQSRRGGADMELIGLADEYQRLVASLRVVEAVDGPPVHQPEPLVAALGRGTLQAAHDTRVLVAFVGETFLALLSAIRRPNTVRWRDVVLYAERAGIGAIPIVTLIGLLLGLILSFQSAISMRKFGAEIFVADLIGISMIKELGPLMASVMLTARSGSAFAAEIGTMKINEEIDALTTMGLAPVRFLVVPRVIAAVIVVPTLTMLMILSALVGGGIIMLTMGYPVTTYVNRLSQATSPAALGEGLTKALVFGFIVAAVGCQRGLATRSGAGAVGQSTTDSVVSGIILIAIIDGFFALCVYLMKS